MKKQYIDKSAVAAEIKRRISLFKKEKKIEKLSAGASQMNVVSLGARIAMLEEILPFLDSLETKDIDLEKEFDKCCENYIFDDECEIYTAKHFFELGIKSKGE